MSIIDRGRRLRNNLSVMAFFETFVRCYIALSLIRNVKVPRPLSVLAVANRIWKLLPNFIITDVVTRLLGECAGMPSLHKIITLQEWLGDWRP